MSGQKPLPHRPGRLLGALPGESAGRRLRALAYVCYFPALLVAGLAAPLLAVHRLGVSLAVALQWATVATMVGYLTGIVALR